MKKKEILGSICLLILTIAAFYGAVLLANTSNPKLGDLFNWLTPKPSTEPVAVNPTPTPGHATSPTPTKTPTATPTLTPTPSPGTLSFVSPRTPVVPAVNVPNADQKSCGVMFRRWMGYTT